MPVVYHSLDASAHWLAELCGEPVALSMSEEVQNQCWMWHKQGMPDTSVTGSVDGLRRFYLFRNEEAVRQFAASNPNVIIGLSLAADAVTRYFPDAQLALDVYRDREQPDYALLALRIMTHSRYPHTREQLKRFRKEWWDPHIAEAVDEKIALGVEPV